MTDIAASLGLVQLKRAEELNKKRAIIAQRYNDAFLSNDKIQILNVAQNVQSSWHLYVIKVENRDELMQQLKDMGIGTSLHFIPIFNHPYYKNTYGYQSDHYPVAQHIYNQSISLPIFPDLALNDVDIIIDAVINNV